MSDPSIMDLLPPAWKHFGICEDSFDPKLLEIYRTLKDAFPNMYVNYLDGARVCNWCGYRTPDCNIGAPKSAHRQGKALDLHMRKPEWLAHLREYIMQKGIEMGIKRVEDFAFTPTWVHIDLLLPNEARWTDKTKPYVFKP